MAIAKPENNDPYDMLGVPSLNSIKPLDPAKQAAFDKALKQAGVMSAPYGQMEDAPMHPDSDLLDQLEQLSRSGHPVMIARANGEVEVRVGAIACFGSTIRSTIRQRIQLEVDRVTQGLGIGAAEGAGQITRKP